MRSTFNSPDGHATVVCDGGMFGDTWTLSVGQHVVDKCRMGFFKQMSVGVNNPSGWANFKMSGGGYKVTVNFNTRTREFMVLFV
jgi:hypothetical protein